MVGKWSPKPSMGVQISPALLILALVAQMVEHLIGNEKVAGSIPVVGFNAMVAQMVEHLY